MLILRCFHNLVKNETRILVVFCIYTYYFCSIQKVGKIYRSWNHLCALSSWIIVGIFYWIVGYCVDIRVQLVNSSGIISSQKLILVGLYFIDIMVSSIFDDYVCKSTARLCLSNENVSKRAPKK